MKCTRTVSESLRFPCSNGTVLNTKELKLNKEQKLNSFSTSFLDGKDEQNLELNSSYQTLKGKGLVSYWSLTPAVAG